MKRDSSLLLQQMQDAAMRAVQYVDGMNLQTFLKDTRTQEAVSLNLLIIGEIAGTLVRDHADIVAAMPQLPLRNMQAMRNRIAHGYFAMNMNIVWDTVDVALPDLVRHLESIRNLGVEGSSASNPGTIA